jgi:hypothetical protein
MIDQMTFKCHIYWLAYWIVQRMNDINRTGMKAYDDDGIHSDDPGKTDTDQDTPAVKGQRTKAAKRNRAVINIADDDDDDGAGAGAGAGSTTKGKFKGRRKRTGAGACATEEKTPKRPKKGAQQQPSPSPSPSADDERDEDYVDDEDEPPRQRRKKAPPSPCSSDEVEPNDEDDEEDGDGGPSSKSRGGQKKGSSAAASAAPANFARRTVPGTKAAAKDSMTSKYTTDDFISRLNEISGRKVGTYIKISAFSKMVKLIVKANKVSTNLFVKPNKVRPVRVEGGVCVFGADAHFPQIVHPF